MNTESTASSRRFLAAVVSLVVACSSEDGSRDRSSGVGDGGTVAGVGGDAGRGGSTLGSMSGGASVGGTMFQGGVSSPSGGALVESGGSLGKGGDTQSEGDATNPMGGTVSLGGRSPSEGGNSAEIGGMSSGQGGTSSVGGSISGVGGTGAESGTFGGAQSGGTGGTAGRGDQGGDTSESTGGTTSISSGGTANTAGVSGGAGAAGAGVLVEHPRQVLLCDEGNRRVLLVDLENPSTAVWSTPLDDAAKYGGGLRDLQLIGDDRVAVSVATGYVELDVRTGEVLKEVTQYAGVESLRRLPDGHTILGGNSDGGVTLQELDASDVVVQNRKITFTEHSDLRMLRRTREGTFLIGLRYKLVEVDWDKQTLWEMAIPGGDWVYQGLRLPDSTIAVTSGYGAAILVIDPATQTVRVTIGGKNQPDATEIVPNFYGGFQVLQNGHFVVTNWEGHGGGNGTKGIQLLEYDAEGVLVWSWKQDPNLVSSLHHVIVLDGLDTTRLHDDVDGILSAVVE